MCQYSSYLAIIIVVSNLAKGQTMTNALSLITIGHWSQDGKLSPQHIRGEHSNVILYSCKEELLENILDMFSFQGNTAVNLTGDATNGNISVQHNMHSMFS